MWLGIQSHLYRRRRRHSHRNLLLLYPVFLLVVISRQATFALKAPYSPLAGVIFSAPADASRTAAKCNPLLTS